MRLKCPLCEFEWECDNTPEKQEENNRISSNHIEIHRPFPPFFSGWIDLNPIPPLLTPVPLRGVPPPQNGLMEDFPNPSVEVSEPPTVSEVIV
jgi:hypothetical protein